MEKEDKFPLHTAAREGRVPVAEGLLKSDPKLSQRKDDDGRYPIHWAASSNNFEIVQLLANQRSFDADVQSALHFVASKKNLDIARILIDNGASTRVRDRRGQYPIHRAAAVGSVPMVNILLKNRSPLNPTDNEGYTPLHHAIAEGHDHQETQQSPFSKKAQTSPSRTAQKNWPWIWLQTKK
ncbi:hypothetical protein HYE68_006586 [Fusarium pseudograminearum]|nr:hypothetical protein HYE68_006586 [Fusarium pseudograminearum]